MPGDTEDNNNGKFSCSWEVSEKTDSAKKHTGSSVAGWPQTKGDKILKLKHTDFGNEGLSCSIAWDEESTPSVEDTAKEPSLDVTITDRREKEFKIKAVTKNAESWVFSWKNKDVPQTIEAQTKADGPATKSATPPGLASTLESQTTAASLSEPAAGGEVTRKRFSAEYKVCGVLNKSGEGEREKCVSIAPLGKKKDKKPKTSGIPMGPGGPMPPPVQMRGAADTSAVGIK
jgi:hypothetical protein